MSSENAQIFQPIERSNRGRQSEVCEKDFLNLIAKNADIFKGYGKMLPVNHQIITEFADALGATRKGMHLKIKKYFEVTKFFSIDKNQRVTTEVTTNAESEDEIIENVGYTKENHQILLLSSDERLKLIPVIGPTRPQMPENWTFYIAELLWESGTKTECAYSFKNGNIVDGELKTNATCNECEAHFDIYSEGNFKSIHIIWINKGNTKIIHKKKRKFTKNVKILNAQALSNTSSTTYLRQKAVEKMKYGDVIPATIAKAGNLKISMKNILYIFYPIFYYFLATYRKMASRYVQHKLLDDDVTHSIYIAGQTEPYSDYIRYLYIYPALIVQYHSSTQLDWYEHHSSLEYTCISIDATGGIMSPIKPPIGKYILLSKY